MPKAKLTPEQRKAEYDAMLEAHIEKIVDGFPPLTDEQIWKISTLLYGDAAGRVRDKSPDEIRREKARQRELAERAEDERKLKAFAAAVLECAVCGVPVQGHSRSWTSHEWEPRQDMLRRAARARKKP